METEYASHMTNTFIKVSGFVTIIAVVALALKIISMFSKKVSKVLPKKYRDVKIAPRVTENIEPDYITDLNKEMEEAGVDNLHDLEQYQENKKLN